MKVPFPGILALAALAISATSLSAQTLGSAANYDILALNGGVVEFTSSGKLFGEVGFSSNTAVKVGKNSQAYNGTLYVHSTATVDNLAAITPTNGVKKSAAVDAALNQANADIQSYVNYLDGLTANQTYGKVSTDFSYSSTMGVTVLDFLEVDLDQETFTLNGRVGFSDQIIIRVSDNFELKESDLVLNNLDSDNVIWYYTGDNQFDLHKSNSDPNLFMKFAGTVIAPNGQVRLGEVDFTGRVYGSDLKMGSGFQFQGAVPEPSSSLLVLVGAGGLLLRRRRLA